MARLSRNRYDNRTGIGDNMDGILHVLNQLGQAHAQALAVIEQQAKEIAELKEALQAK